jgi:flagellar basal body-associated protein FliL
MKNRLLLLVLIAGAIAIYFFTKGDADKAPADETKTEQTEPAAEPETEAADEAADVEAEPAAEPTTDE